LAWICAVVVAVGNRAVGVGGASPQPAKSPHVPKTMHSRISCSVLD
jgi:hypothetical protein